MSAGVYCLLLVYITCLLYSHNTQCLQPPQGPGMTGHCSPLIVHRPGGKKMIQSHLQVNYTYFQYITLYIVEFTSYTATPDAFDVHVDIVCLYLDDSVTNLSRQSGGDHSHSHWHCLTTWLFPLGKP